MFSRNGHDEDDIFSDTRMSFGDHIEDLRKHLWKAIAGLVVCMVGGFLLDGLGDLVGEPRIGVGRPLMEVIKRPVSLALEDFYNRRMEKVENSAKIAGSEAAKVGEPRDMRFTFPREAVAKISGRRVEEVPDAIDVEAKVSPLDWYKMTEDVRKLVRPPELKTLSATEGFMIYFKVTLIAGFVIAAPYVFWQIWS